MFIISQWHPKSIRLSAMAGQTYICGLWNEESSCEAQVHAEPLQAMFDILEADIVVFQETKIQRKDLTDDMVLVPGWDCYFSLPKYKKGSYPLFSRSE